MLPLPVHDLARRVGVCLRGWVARVGLQDTAEATAEERRKILRARARSVALVSLTEMTCEDHGGHGGRHVARAAFTACPTPESPARCERRLERPGSPLCAPCARFSSSVIDTRAGLYRENTAAAGNGLSQTASAGLPPWLPAQPRDAHAHPASTRPATLRRSSSFTAEGWPERSASIRARARHRRTSDVIAYGGWLERIEGPTQQQRPVGDREHERDRARDPHRARCRAPEERPQET